MSVFQTPAPITVNADALSGNVTVIASDRTDTVVAVRPADPAKKADVRAAEQTRVEFADGTLTVKTPKSWRTHTPFGGNPTIEVTIEVPTGSRVAAVTGVGTITGNGELGECNMEVAMGDIVVSQPQGSVTAKTSKGAIRIGEAVRGVMRLETSMGDLEIGIRPGSAARVETSTQTGNVSNRLAPVAEDGDTVHVIARTSMGNIIVQHTAAA
ncbi:hypothetical protein [Nocardia sp. NBC_00511]|uniref:hypothetical protein n=1 Tax=Nocardia sp. NBC_00511 TaxID=2903591 RepID=UPI0030E5D2C2